MEAADVAAMVVREANLNGDAQINGYDSTKIAQVDGRTGSSRPQGAGPVWR